MNKKISLIILIVLIILVIILLETLVIFIKLNYFQIENGSKKVTEYKEKYTIENILYKYINELVNSPKNYGKFSRVFNAKSYIKEKEIIKILDIYDFNNHEYEIKITELIKLSTNQYKCKYSLYYETEALADGYVEGEELYLNAEQFEYINEIIIDVNYEKNGFKVLYNKFDLGNGEYYEK